ncbi:hypothetical protein O3M35_000353 [Rhynocoris fuscipes]|uniref:Receptor L-domain domain-containing protein n=1 Tax=Rhynocoris fuscipes TaxID=488301 RepID=A0AAW1DPV3_9HEMI
MTFPELREITSFLLVNRVAGLRSLGRLFPNLSIIRGENLFLNYALVIAHMPNLMEINLSSVTILRGSVAIAWNPSKYIYIILLLLEINISHRSILNITGMI